jgi:hypothetical protein
MSAARTGWVTFDGADGGDGEEEWELVDAGSAAGARAKALSHLAAITGLSIPVADELLDRAGGDVHKAVELHLDSTPAKTTPPLPARPHGAPASVGPASGTASAAAAHDSAPGARGAARPPPDCRPNFSDGSWLSLLRKQGSQLEDIQRRVEESGEPFRDPLFPAGPRALGEGCTGAAEVRQWRRPVEIWEGGEPMLFKGELAPSDVIQGRLKDCWLLGSFAIAAAKPKLLQSLVDFSWVEKGLHAIRFFVEGEWVTVVVDDLIPVDALERPVFGRCRQPHHIWVQIFEKAFAKLCGSFQAVEYGSEDEGLVHLTGGFPKTVDLHKEEEELLDGRMWRR